MENRFLHWDILYQEEHGCAIQGEFFNNYLTALEMKHLKRPGINSGTWAVRGSIYNEVMEEWAAIDRGQRLRREGWGDQSAWNRLILDVEARTQHQAGAWRTKKFEAHEIQFPLHLNMDFRNYRHAAILHAVGGSAEEKVAFLQTMYLGQFFADPSGLFLSFLDM